MTAPALALARVTARDQLAQPLTRTVLAVTAILLFLSSLMPSFTLDGTQGDLKFLLDVGLASTALCLAVLAVWPAATLLTDELAQRTAMTVLAKPLSRRDYLLGRYLGLLGSLAVSAAVLTVLLLLFAWLTEAQVLTAPLERWLDGIGEDAPVSALTVAVRWDLAGGVLLGFAQAAVLAALALACSTRLPVMATLAACLGIYLLGHVAGTLPSGPLAWGLRLLLPDLELYDLSEAAARGMPIPATYAAGGLLYASLYAAAAMALAVRLFERREIV